MVSSFPREVFETQQILNPYKNYGSIVWNYGSIASTVFGSSFSIDHIGS